MENDLNTYGYNNWFFFRVRNAGTGVRRFTIANFTKKTNFFAQGMLVSIFSAQQFRSEGTGWFKGGDRVSFGTVNLPRTHHQDSHHCLSFEWAFPHEDDCVYFALNQPYTYSRLVNLIAELRVLPSPRYYPAKQCPRSQDPRLFYLQQHPAGPAGKQRRAVCRSSPGAGPAAPLRDSGLLPG